jgi:hypothetical protein
MNIEEIAPAWLAPLILRLNEIQTNIDAIMVGQDILLIEIHNLQVDVTEMQLDIQEILVEQHEVATDLVNMENRIDYLQHVVVGLLHENQPVQQ